MDRSQRMEHERPFKFTIEVEAVVGGWVARVDTDDDEREFQAVTREGAEKAAEAFCRDWALAQPGSRPRYSYDYSPLVGNRRRA